MNDLIKSVVNFLILVFVIRIDGITISPDLQYRNSTGTSNRKKLQINQNTLTTLTNDTSSISRTSDGNNLIETDRQRRLIPYMTFYIPNHEYNNPPINQAYAYNMPLKLHPIQQQQQQAINQPIKQQLILVQQQERQAQGHGHQYQSQPIYRPSSYGSQPKYQRPNIPQLSPIAYNTRHQQQTHYKQYAVATTPKPKVYYEPQPIVYKQISSAGYEQQQHQHYQKYQKQQSHIITPFLPSNQVPGRFVPMSNHYAPTNVAEQHDINGGVLVEHDNGQKEEPEKERSYHQEQNHQNYITQTSPATPQKYYNHNYEQHQQQQHATPEPIKHYYQYEKYNPDTYVNTKKIVLQPEHHFVQAPQQQHLIDEEPQFVKYRSHAHHQQAKHNTEYHVNTNQVYLRPVESPPPTSTHRPAVTKLTLHQGMYGGFKPVSATPPAPFSKQTVAEVYDNNQPFEYYPKLSHKPIYYPVSTTPTPHRTKAAPKIQLRPTPSTRYSTAKPITRYAEPSNYPVYVTAPTPQPTIKTVKLTPAPQHHYDEDTEDLNSHSLAHILKKLQDSNTLPQTLTPDNIDNSIRTLVKILNNLKETQTIHQAPPEKHQHIDYNTGDDYYDTDDENSGQLGSNSGKPGIDYPVLAEIPKTSFACKEQRYKGFFGDPETNCQVWHYCDLNGGQASFLCPNGTIFSQVALTCDWWFNVKCSSTAQLYVLNERLYKYILPFQPKFPEDYSGPLVDKYLALKFQEMEEKMRREKSKGKVTTQPTTSSEENDEPAEPVPVISEKSAPEADEQQHHSTTEMSRPPPISLPPVPYTAIETEKVEVIEIKPAGNSGHLTPNHNPDYDDRL